jgi:tRNA threonylcarbamoyladenosine biosynthesis protein TsaB
MPVILSLETSTDVCSVALHDGEKLLAQEEVHEPQSHAARLAPMIDAVSHQAGIPLKEVNAVAVTGGPGSYTGLRIGTSTAKGLCYAMDIPLISVGTLELLAFQGNTQNASHALLCPMIDARRMEVYCLVADHHLKILRPVSAEVIDEKSFRELLEGSRVLFLGNGSKKCRAVITHPNALFLEGVFPQAAVLGVMAEKKFQAGQFEDLVHFKPFYLKEFVAKKPGAGK